MPDEHQYLYKSIGFKYTEYTDPSCWFMDVSYAERILISESDSIKEHEYDRIWDCGNLKYIMDNI